MSGGADVDERPARVASVLRELGADWAMLTAPDSVAYATGHCERLDSGADAFAAGPAVALVSIDGTVGLLAPRGAERRRALDARTDHDAYGRHHREPGLDRYAAALDSLMRRLGVGGTIAIEPANCTAAVLACLPSARTVDIGPALRRARAIKTAPEVGALRRAGAVAAVGQRALLAALRPGITELELFGALRIAMEREAGERVAVGGDLVSGRERTAAIGGWPTARVLAPGDAVLADLAPRVGDTWGDSAATVVLGEPSAGQRRLFAAAAAGLEHALGTLRPGLGADRFHAAVRDTVRAHGGDYPHHTGHGIGTAVHEHPRLCADEPSLIETGMVLMVEPGAYDPAIGGVRLEWMLLVTPTGCEPLAPFEHRLAI